MRFTLLVLLACILVSFDHSEWFQEGTYADYYLAGADSTVKFMDKQIFTVKSIKDNPDSLFNTWMTTMKAGRYLGKRIRMTAYMKTLNVTSWSGLWLRVDKKTEDFNDAERVLAFDNMSNRPVVGTTKWKKYQIVLDVPTSAMQIACGGMIGGNGQIWFSHPSFEIVPKSVPVTGK